MQGSLISFRSRFLTKSSSFAPIPGFIPGFHLLRPEDDDGGIQVVAARLNHAALALPVFAPVADGGGVVLVGSVIATGTRGRDKSCGRCGRHHARWPGYAGHGGASGRGNTGSVRCGESATVPAIRAGNRQVAHHRRDGRRDGGGSGRAFSRTSGGHARGATAGLGHPTRRARRGALIAGTCAGAAAGRLNERQNAGGRAPALPGARGPGSGKRRETRSFDHLCARPWPACGR